MNAHNESTDKLTQDTESTASPVQKKQYKLSWYAVLREKPEALAKFKEYANQRYEARKNAKNELAAMRLLYQQ